MKTTIIIFAVLILFSAFCLIGSWMNGRKLRRLLRERDNLNLTTHHGKQRAKVINKQIDRIYQ